MKKYHQWVWILNLNRRGDLSFETEVIRERGFSNLAVMHVCAMSRRNIPGLTWSVFSRLTGVNRLGSNAMLFGVSSSSKNWKLTTCIYESVSTINLCLSLLHYDIEVYLHVLWIMIGRKWFILQTLFFNYLQLQCVNIKSYTTSTILMYYQTNLHTPLSTAVQYILYIKYT